MRKIMEWLLICGAVTLAAPNAFAGDREDAVAIVDEAIKAHGGADALTKAQTLVRAGVGTLTLFNDKIPFTDEVSWSLPDRWRVSINLEKRGVQSIILNGDKGWQSAGGPAMELGAERLREISNEVYVLWLATLTPLKKDGVQLSPVPDIKVNGEAAVGVKATSKGRPDVKLYFDKKTHLLVKIERRVSEAGVQLNKEDFYSDYKDFDGVQLPTKLMFQISGRKFSELTNATYKLPKKIDDALFTKP
jgi:zinc protease